MLKYPVVSGDNKYLVTVTETEFSGHYIVKLYVDKKIFNHEYKKKVYYDEYYEGYYTDYIADNTFFIYIVKKTVKEYEDLLLKKSHVSKSQKMFEDWNGIVK